MSSPAQPLSASTGTETAATPGLYTFHDFIRPGEEPLYAELDSSLREDLAPVGMLENTLVDEIRRAMWRLRRCGLVEERLSDESLTAQPNLDPMHQESAAQTQLNVDRARTQAHRLIHKCTTELRRFQTERMYRNETFEVGADLSEFGLTDWRIVRKGADQKFMADYRRQKFEGMAEIDALLSAPFPPPARRSSFCKAESSFCKTDSQPVAA